MNVIENVNDKTLNQMLRSMRALDLEKDSTLSADQVKGTLRRFLVCTKKLINILYYKK